MRSVTAPGCGNSKGGEGEINNNGAVGGVVPAVENGGIDAEGRLVCVPMDPTSAVTAVEVPTDVDAGLDARQRHVPVESVRNEHVRKVRRDRLESPALCFPLEGFVGRRRARRRVPGECKTIRATQAGFWKPTDTHALPTKVTPLIMAWPSAM